MTSRMLKWKLFSSKWLKLKKKDLANALKEAKHRCKEFDFTAGMLKASFMQGLKKQ